MSENLVPLAFALVCGGFFFILILALGVYLVSFSVRSKKKAEASQAWPSVPGVILTSEVKRTMSTDDDGNTDYSYHPAVSYSYQVNGQPYESKLMAFGGVVGHSNPTKAQEQLKPFPVGAQVPVFFNPEKPQEAVLSQKPGGAKMALIGGIICIVLSICIACPLLIGVARNILPMLRM